MLFYTCSYFFTFALLITLLHSSVLSVHLVRKSGVHTLTPAPCNFTLTGRFFCNGDTVYIIQGYSSGPGYVTLTIAGHNPPTIALGTDPTSSNAQWKMVNVENNNAYIQFIGANGMYMYRTNTELPGGTNITKILVNGTNATDPATYWDVYGSGLIPSRPASGFSLMAICKTCYLINGLLPIGMAHYPTPLEKEINLVNGTVFSVDRDPHVAFVSIQNGVNGRGYLAINGSNAGVSFNPSFGMVWRQATANGGGSYLIGSTGKFLRANTSANYTVNNVVYTNVSVNLDIKDINFSSPDPSYVWDLRSGHILQHGSQLNALVECSNSSCGYIAGTLRPVGLVMKLNQTMLGIDVNAQWMGFN